MEMTGLIVILALATMLSVLVWAMVSKARIEKRLKDPKAGKSTLASDAPSTGTPVDV